jgi:hypothetical protein
MSGSVMIHLLHAQSYFCTPVMGLHLVTGLAGAGDGRRAIKVLCAA